MGCSSSKISAPGNGITITVKTGDLKFSGTDNDVFIVLHDDEKNSSGKLNLDNRFINDFERGKIDTFNFKNSELKLLRNINKVEVWREGKVFGDNWFLEYIRVANNYAGTTHIFPVHRWVPLNDAIVIREYDSYFAHEDEERREQRTRELNRKKQMYQLNHTLDPPGMPPRILDMPDDESFSDDYKWDLKKRKYELFCHSKLANIFTGSWNNLEDIKNVYGSESFPEPESIKVMDGMSNRWMTDEYFAEQRLTGCNPALIRLCTQIPENFPVTSEMVGPFLEGKSLEEALDAKKLFLINHAITDNLVKTRDELILCSPMCLFYLNDNQQLLPIAIQLFQTPGEGNPVFLPSDPKYTWLLAKMWFNNADASVHEAVSHLGFTHIVMEGVAVTTHRQLSPSHPLFRLLAPHFLYLIAINTKAVSKLVSPGGWVDKSMTIGRQGMMGLLSRAFSDWRLNVQGTLPRDLEERGVADPAVLPYYPYRDDANLIYQAILEYVTDILQPTYSNGDENDNRNSVENDEELQAWINELSAPVEYNGCNMKGLPHRFHDVDEIILVVTSIIYTCSVGHASVNFKQYDDYAFPPAYPAIMHGEPPRDKSEKTESDIVKTLPNKETTLDIMTITRILSDRGTKPLGDFEVQYAYDECSLQALNRFRANLQKIEQQIDENNLRRCFPYTVLIPSEIPNAISI